MACKNTPTKIESRSNNANSAHGSSLVINNKSNVASLDLGIKAPSKGIEHFTTSDGLTSLELTDQERFDARGASKFLGVEFGSNAIKIEEDVAAIACGEYTDINKTVVESSGGGMYQVGWVNTQADPDAYQREMTPDVWLLPAFDRGAFGANANENYSDYKDNYFYNMFIIIEYEGTSDSMGNVGGFLANQKQVFRYHDGDEKNAPVGTFFWSEGNNLGGGDVLKVKICNAKESVEAAALAATPTAILDSEFPDGELEALFRGHKDIAMKPTWGRLNIKNMQVVKYTPVVQCGKVDLYTRKTGTITEMLSDGRVTAPSHGINTGDILKISSALTNSANTPHGQAHVADDLVDHNHLINGTKYAEVIDDNTIRLYTDIALSKEFDPRNDVDSGITALRGECLWSVVGNVFSGDSQGWRYYKSLCSPNGRNGYTNRSLFTLDSHKNPTPTLATSSQFLFDKINEVFNDDYDSLEGGYIDSKWKWLLETDLQPPVYKSGNSRVFLDEMYDLPLITITDAKTIVNGFDLTNSCLATRAVPSTLDALWKSPRNFFPHAPCSDQGELYPDGSYSSDFPTNKGYRFGCDIDLIKEKKDGSSTIYKLAVGERGASKVPNYQDMLFCAPRGMIVAGLREGFVPESDKWNMKAVPTGGAYGKAYLFEVKVDQYKRISEVSHTNTYNASSFTARSTPENWICAPQEFYTQETGDTFVDSKFFSYATDDFCNKYKNYYKFEGLKNSLKIGTTTYTASQFETISPFNDFTGEAVGYGSIVGRLDMVYWLQSFVYHWGYEYFGGTYGLDYEDLSSSEKTELIPIDYLPRRYYARSGSRDVLIQQSNNHYFSDLMLPYSLFDESPSSRSGKQRTLIDGYNKDSLFYNPKLTGRAPSEWSDQNYVSSRVSDYDSRWKDARLHDLYPFVDSFGKAVALDLVDGTVIVSASSKSKHKFEVNDVIAYQRDIAKTTAVGDHKGFLESLVYIQPSYTNSQGSGGETIRPDSGWESKKPELRGTYAGYVRSSALDTSQDASLGQGRMIWSGQGHTTVVGPGGFRSQYYKAEKSGICLVAEDGKLIWGESYAPQFSPSSEIGSLTGTGQMVSRIYVNSGTGYSGRQDFFNQKSFEKDSFRYSCDIPTDKKEVYLRDINVASTKGDYAGWYIYPSDRFGDCIKYSDGQIAANSYCVRNEFEQLHPDATVDVNNFYSADLLVDYLQIYTFKNTWQFASKISASIDSTDSNYSYRDVLDVGVGTSLRNLGNINYSNHLIRSKTWDIDLTNRFEWANDKIVLKDPTGYCAFRSTHNPKEEDTNTTSVVQCPDYFAFQEKFTCETKRTNAQGTVTTFPTPSVSYNYDGLIDASGPAISVYQGDADNQHNAGVVFFRIPVPTEKLSTVDGLTVTFKYKALEDVKRELESPLMILYKYDPRTTIYPYYLKYPQADASDGRYLTHSFRGGAQDSHFYRENSFIGNSDNFYLADQQLGQSMFGGVNYIAKAFEPRISSTPTSLVDRTYSGRIVISKDDLFNFITDESLIKSSTRTITETYGTYTVSFDDPNKASYISSDDNSKYPSLMVGFVQSNVLSADAEIVGQRDRPFKSPIDIEDITLTTSDSGTRLAVRTPYINAAQDKYYYSADGTNLSGEGGIEAGGNGTVETETTRLAKKAEFAKTNSIWQLQHDRIMGNMKVGVTIHYPSDWPVRSLQNRRITKSFNQIFNESLLRKFDKCNTFWESGKGCPPDAECGDFGYEELNQKSFAELFHEHPWTAYELEDKLAELVGEGNVKVYDGFCAPRPLSTSEAGSNKTYGDFDLPAGTMCPYNSEWHDLLGYGVPHEGGASQRTISGLPQGVKPTRSNAPHLERLMTNTSYEGTGIFDNGEPNGNVGRTYWNPWFNYFIHFTGELEGIKVTMGLDASDAYAVEYNYYDTDCSGNDGAMEGKFVDGRLESPYKNPAGSTPCPPALPPPPHDATSRDWVERLKQLATMVCRLPNSGGSGKTVMGLELGYGNGIIKWGRKPTGVTEITEGGNDNPDDVQIVTPGGCQQVRVDPRDVFERYGSSTALPCGYPRQAGNRKQQPDWKLSFASPSSSNSTELIPQSTPEMPQFNVGYVFHYLNQLTSLTGKPSNINGGFGRSDSWVEGEEGNHSAVVIFKGELGNKNIYFDPRGWKKRPNNRGYGLYLGDVDTITRGPNVDLDLDGDGRTDKRSGKGASGSIISLKRGGPDADPAVPEVQTIAPIWYEKLVAPEGFIKPYSAQGPDYWYRRQVLYGENTRGKVGKRRWRLTFDGQTTAWIYEGATADQVQASLNALSNIGTVSVTEHGPFAARGSLSGFYSESWKDQSPGEEVHWEYTVTWEEPLPTNPDVPLITGELGGVEPKTVFYAPKRTNAPYINSKNLSWSVKDNEADKRTLLGIVNEIQVVATTKTISNVRRYPCVFAKSANFTYEKTNNIYNRNNNEFIDKLVPSNLGALTDEEKSDLGWSKKDRRLKYTNPVLGLGSSTAGATVDSSTPSETRGTFSASYQMLSLDTLYTTKTDAASYISSREKSDLVNNFESWKTDQPIKSYGSLNYQYLRSLDIQSNRNEFLPLYISAEPKVENTTTIFMKNFEPASAASTIYTSGLYTAAGSMRLTMGPVFLENDLQQLVISSAHGAPFGTAPLLLHSPRPSALMPLSIGASGKTAELTTYVSGPSGFETQLNDATQPDYGATLSINPPVLSSELATLSLPDNYGAISSPECDYPHLFIGASVETSATGTMFLRNQQSSGVLNLSLQGIRADSGVMSLFVTVPASSGISTLFTRAPYETGVNSFPLFVHGGNRPITYDEGGNVSYVEAASGITTLTIKPPVAPSETASLYTAYNPSYANSLDDSLGSHGAVSYKDEVFDISSYAEPTIENTSTNSLVVSKYNADAIDYDSGYVPIPEIGSDILTHKEDGDYRFYYNNRIKESFDSNGSYFCVGTNSNSDKNNTRIQVFSVGSENKIDLAYSYTGLKDDLISASILSNDRDIIRAYYKSIKISSDNRIAASIGLVTADKNNPSYGQRDENVVFILEKGPSDAWSFLVGFHNHSSSNAERLRKEIGLSVEWDGEDLYYSHGYYDRGEGGHITHRLESQNYAYGEKAVAFSDTDVFNTYRSNWSNLNLEETKLAFGHKIIIDGDLMFVSCPLLDGHAANNILTKFEFNAFRGAVFIFKRAGGIWSHADTLYQGGYTSSTISSTSYECAYTAKLFGYDIAYNSRATLLAVGEPAGKKVYGYKVGNNGSASLLESHIGSSDDQDYGAAVGIYNMDIITFSKKIVLSSGDEYHWENGRLTICPPRGADARSLSGVIYNLKTGVSFNFDTDNTYYEMLPYITPGRAFQFAKEQLSTIRLIDFKTGDKPSILAGRVFDLDSGNESRVIRKLSFLDLDRANLTAYPAMFIQGPYASENTTPLYIRSYDTSSGSMSLSLPLRGTGNYTTMFIQPDDAAQMTLNIRTAISGVFPLHMQNWWESGTNARNLFMKMAEPLSSGMSLHASGLGTSTAGQPLLLYNGPQFGSHSLMIKQRDGVTDSGVIPAYTYGASVGGAHFMNSEAADESPSLYPSGLFLSLNGTLQNPLARTFPLVLKTSPTGTLTGDTSLYLSETTPAIRPADSSDDSEGGVYVSGLPFMIAGVGLTPWTDATSLYMPAHPLSSGNTSLVLYRRGAGGGKEVEGNMNMSLINVTESGVTSLVAGGEYGDSNNLSLIMTSGTGFISATGHLYIRGYEV